MNFERNPRGSFLPRDNKEHVNRIRWDYFRFSSRAPIARWKFRIALLALILVGVPTLAYFVAPRFVDAKSTPGEVHHVHAAWDQTCEACHVPNRSVSSLTSGKWNEFRCEQCHLGPVHHQSAKLDEKKQSCGACHRDHRGAEISLTRLPDTDCTSCHSNLIDFYKDEYKEKAKGRYENKITAFHTDHPEFALVKGYAEKKLTPENHRSLKFSHAAHNTAGIPTGGDGKWTVAQIKDPQQKERYRAITSAVTGKPTLDSDLVQLNCAACHATDSSQQQPAMEKLFDNPVEARPDPLLPADQVNPAFDITKGFGNLPRQPLLPPRGQGDYMQPIVYENHCKACHPLNFSTEFPTETMPHRLQKDDIKDFFERVYSKVLIDEFPNIGVPPRTTGRLDPRIDFDAILKTESLKPEDKKRVTEFREKLKKSASDAEQKMYFVGNGCVKCHDVKQENGKVTEVKRTFIPVIWMEHSKFNHASHHAMKCVSCHPNSSQPLPSDIKATLVEKGPLDLPSITNCTQCHAPRSKNDKGEVVGGIRANCTDCHSYHNGDHTLAGFGDPSRGPKDGKLFEIADLLRGALEKDLPKK